MNTIHVTKQTTTTISTTVSSPTLKTSFCMEKDNEGICLVRINRGHDTIVNINRMPLEELDQLVTCMRTMVDKLKEE